MAAETSNHRLCSCLGLPCHNMQGSVSFSILALLSHGSLLLSPIRRPARLPQRAHEANPLFPTHVPALRNRLLVAKSSPDDSGSGRDLVLLKSSTKVCLSRAGCTLQPFLALPLQTSATTQQRCRFLPDSRSWAPGSLHLRLLLLMAEINGLPVRVFFSLRWEVAQVGCTWRLPNH